MRVAKFGAAAAAALVGACGGGGSGNTPAPTPTPTTPTLPVTLSASSATVNVPEGQIAKFGFTASYTGTSTQPVVADVKVNGTRYALDGAPTGSGSQFAVNLATSPFVPGGRTTSTVSFRLCTSPDCATVYPGSAQTFSVDLNVQLADWATFQRNAAHTAYVAVKYDPAQIQKKWEWAVADTESLKAPAANGDTLFVTVRTTTPRPSDPSTPPSFGSVSAVYALASADGAQRWRADLGYQYNASGPGFANGRVHVSSMEMSSGNNPQWSLDAATGAVQTKFAFGAQWSNFNQPLPVGDMVYIASGYYGNELYAFDAASRTVAWQTRGVSGNIWDGETPAADADHLFYYSGASMDVFNRTTGTLAFSIPDPSFSWRGYSWFAAPILDGKGGIYAFSSPRMYEWDTRIAGYSTAARRQTWLSAAAYTRAPAYASDRIYAARAKSGFIDILSSTDGKVSASIAIPDGAEALSNIVVTKNLLFVSTALHTYAFDIENPANPVVWTVDGGGHLAITPDNTLVVVQQNKVIAYRLS